jgi:hypothetical protein
MAIKLTIDDARIDKTPCAYNADNTVARVHYTLVSHGVNIAYCDTEIEAKAVLQYLRDLPVRITNQLVRCPPGSPVAP